jgi:glycosyltransferase involved in cell wall biosynthesis
VWEHDIDHWVRAIRRFRCVGLISTSAQAAALIADALPGFPVESVPEAIQVSRYLSTVPLSNRSTGVLELGRRYEKWHGEVLDALRTAEVPHLYEREKGQLVFPTDAEMVAGLQNAAISVCFPRSMTHPESAGAIETMTQRYLESMAAGCLILGHAPAEMIEFFGYNPVIEADPVRPAEQLSSILAHLDEHQDLVDRNREAVVRMGDWQERAKEIVATSQRIAWGSAR